MTLTVGSLFSGIGGLDLGLERAGMEVIWQSEIDPYACRVLKKHWPEVPNHGDIKRIDWGTVERPSVICGGYPCQPFSTAGKRQGEEDPRHLWPWVREAISALRPDYAILENVRGHLSLGGTSVLADLASIGYDAEWRIVSAASVGANHRRDRIIIVAYPNGERCDQRRVDDSPWVNCGGGEKSADDMAYPSQQFSDGREHRNSTSQVGNGNALQASPGGSGVDVAYTDAWTYERGDWSISEVRRTVFPGPHNRRGAPEYAGWKWWQTESNVGRVAHGIPSRVDRLRGLGNAVVPQVAEVIGRLVMDHHQRQ